MNRLNRTLINLIICLLIGSLCAGCTGKNGEDEEKAYRDNTPLFLSCAPSGENIKKNKYAVIDLSDVNKGYINIKYLKDEKACLQLKSKNTVYTYLLHYEKGYEAFPLSLGSGKYTAAVYKSVGSSSYVQVLSASFSVKLENEREPFLRPNQYVNYSDTEEFSALSLKLGEKCENELDTVKAIYSYIVKNIDYNYQLAQAPPVDYVPDISRIIKEKDGICFDYASLMCALCRSQGIPAKLVVGYSSESYHAWISVYTEELGWIDKIVYFDGSGWTYMDPTYDATFKGTKTDLSKYVGDKTHYNPMFYY